MKLAFIGGGTMAEAMFSAILQQGLAANEDITIGEVAEERRLYLQDKYRIKASPDNKKAISGKEVIVLAVKPQSLEDIAKELKGQIEPEQLLISVLAGKSIGTLSSSLSHHCIVRSMPNTPARIGKGITVWTATSRVSGPQRAQAAALLATMGEEIFVDDEKYLDMATAVSGSGPAYVFFFAESMISAAEHLGFSPEVARRLVMQTLLGAGQLLEKSGQTPRELRRMVTSRGGTTEAAITVLEQAGWADLIERAITTAHKKARELGGSTQ